MLNKQDVVARPLLAAENMLVTYLDNTLRAGIGRCVSTDVRLRVLQDAAVTQAREDIWRALREQARHTVEKRAHRP
jgi:hypothetical protein